MPDRLKTRELRLDTVDSTMEAAKALALAPETSGHDFLFVTAETQTRGKGTKGRAWQSPPGNLYVTLGIHRRHLPPARLALLPLEMGLLLWDEIAARLSENLRRDLSLKWPNDLLLRGAKAAGMLMETQGDFILVGIGVNVAFAPPVADGGAASACLAEAGLPPSDKHALAEGVYARVQTALVAPLTGVAADDAGDFDPEKILIEWQGKVDWERPHRLRDRDGQPWVLPLSVNRHGHLRVRHADGRQEWLISDYLI